MKTNLQTRLEKIRKEAQIVSDLSGRHQTAQANADSLKKRLEWAKVQLKNSQDDLMGDMMNGCFPECRLGLDEEGSML